MKVSDIIKRGAVAEFSFYREGNFYYKIGDFTFPVPLADVAGTSLFNNEKAIHLMRWVRIHLETLENQNA